MSQSEPPQAIEIEQAVLGAILKDSGALDRVTPILAKPSEFYSPKHQMIYEAALSVHARSEPVDIVTVVGELQRSGKLDRIGGRVYLVDLTEQVASTGNVATYAGIVQEKALRRKIIAVCQEIVGSCYGQELPADRILDQWQQAAFEIGQGQDIEGFRPLSEDNDAWLARVDKLQSGEAQKDRVLTGFSGIDHWTQGFAPTEMIVLNGKTGQGKTQLALQIARHCAYSQNKPVGILSLEMSFEDLNARIQCAEAWIDHFKVETSGGLRPEELNRLVHAAARTRSPKIFVNESILITPVQLFSSARRLKAQQDIRLLVVDYIQLMDPGAAEDTREREVARMSRWMKVIAKSLNLVMLVLSQVTVIGKEVSSRESKAIENDADKVLLIRHDDKGGASIFVKKQRRGPSNRSVPMNFDQGRWVEIEGKKDC
jgi:replicative DNA helicase